MNSKALAPLSGIVFLALLASGMFYGGEPPSAEKMSAAKLAAAYADKADRLHTAIYLMIIAFIFFLIFASVLKSALDSGVGEDGCLSRLAFAGAIILTTGWAIDMSLVMTATNMAGKVDPVAIQAVISYWGNDFIPFAIGVLTFHLGVAISALKHGGIPKWLGGLSALIVIVGLIPGIGFFAMPATAVWIFLASIALAVQAGKAAPAVA